MKLATRQYRGWAVKFTAYSYGILPNTFAVDGPVHVGATMYSTRREARAHIKRNGWTKVAEAVKVTSWVREVE